MPDTCADEDELTRPRGRFDDKVEEVGDDDSLTAGRDEGRCRPRESGARERFDVRLAASGSASLLSSSVLSPASCTTEKVS